MSHGLRDAAHINATQDSMWAALDTVLDPELDRPVTELGFVQRLDVVGGRAVVELRLPTYFCAANFAYLMVADARRALETLPGVEVVDVTLVDHFAADEINAGLGQDKKFAATFDGLADETEDTDLEELRATFLRKAHRAAQERLVAALLDEGAGFCGQVLDRAAPVSLAVLASVSIGDVGDRPQSRLVRRRRTALGLPAGDTAPLLMDDDGHGIPADQIVDWLRFSRIVRVSIETNTEWCEGLLATRYGATRTA